MGICQYLTNLLPDFITASFLLKTQCKVIIFCFWPNNQGVLGTRKNIMKLITAKIFAHVGDKYGQAIPTCPHNRHAKSNRTIQPSSHRIGARQVKLTCCFWYAVFGLIFDSRRSEPATHNLYKVSIVSQNNFYFLYLSSVFISQKKGVGYVTTYDSQWNSQECVQIVNSF